MRRAFTLIELLVVIAIVSILAAILFPVYAQAKEAAKKANCISNERQIGLGFQMYVADWDELMPDRRDLKTSLPGGFKPWASWPPSDPRAGWAQMVLQPYMLNTQIWSCPSVMASSLGSAQQVLQTTPLGTTDYWMWRFDRTDSPTPLDDFWGKSEDQAVTDLQAAQNPTVGFPQGVSDVELLVDPYFPSTIPTVSAALKGKSVHVGGRNRLFLDAHAKFLRDVRLKP
jgi:prepilin-type N-terminal cleavage/methylation domain-containing protein